MDGIASGATSILLRFERSVVVSDSNLELSSKGFGDTTGLSSCKVQSISTTGFCRDGEKGSTKADLQTET